MTRHRERLATSWRALSALAVGLIAACGSSGSTAATTATTATTSTTAGPATAAGPATTAPAKASGSITVYSGRSEALVKPFFEQFTAATGVQVNVRYGDSGALAAQLLTEGRASPADVFFSQDAGALGAVAKAKLLAPLAQTQLDKVAPTYRAVDTTWVGVSGRVRVIVYDPAQVPAAPTTIDEVLDPKWKGKVGFAPSNASWQSFVTALRVVRGETAAADWLTRFAANSPKSYSGNGAVRDAANSGEVALGLINHYYLYEKIAKDGADKVTAKNAFMAAGDVGNLVNVAGVAVLSTSKNATAAMALVDYLLSDPAQKFFAEKTYEYPLSGSTTAMPGLPPLVTMKPPALDLSDLDSIATTQEALAKAGLLTK